MNKIIVLFILIRFITDIYGAGKPEEKIDKELMEYYDNMEETQKLFHREKKIVNELIDQEVYISPEYLEDSLREIKTKNLDGKIIKTMDKVMEKLSDDNFIKLLLVEMKDALTNIGTS